MPKPEIGSPISPNPTCSACRFWNGNALAGGPKTGTAYDCNNPVCASGTPTGMFIGGQISRHSKPMTAAGFGCIHFEAIRAMPKEIKT